MADRVAQLATIAGYAARQFFLGIQGKTYPLAQLHNRAWFQSSRKKLPTVSVDELFPGSADLSIRLERSLPKATGNMTIEELAVIALVCRWLKPSLLFEFGTFNGRTTLNLAANSPDGAKVYTLDIPNPGQALLAAEQEDSDYHLQKQSGSFFRDSALRDKIEQIWCDSARFDETNLRGQVDFVFVDGAHSFEYVRNDTTKALAMLRPGGAILWHDYCAWYPGVSDYLHSLLPTYPLKHIEGTHLAILADRSL